jgi:hypothetical protein
MGFRYGVHMILIADIVSLWIDYCDYRVVAYCVNINSGHTETNVYYKYSSFYTQN